MIRGDLAKLLRLRRQREEKAMTIVLARRTVLARAEQEAAEANTAASDHARQSVVYERQSLARLIGQALRPGDLVNLQSSLNATADRHQDLLAVEQEASGRRDGCKADLDTARGDFRKRHGQAEKLSALITQEQAKGSRRQLALAESVSDEGHVTGQPAGQTLSQTGSENGDA